MTDAGSGVDPRYLECALVQQGSSSDRACRPDWNARTGVASIPVGRLPAGRYALAVRAGDYAESRDALAIAISPQHVRTRVIGLRVDARGAIRVGRRRRARPRSRPRRQVDGGVRRGRPLGCGHGRCDPVHAWRPERRHAARRRLPPRARGRDGAGADGRALVLHGRASRAAPLDRRALRRARRARRLRQRLARGVRVRGQRAAGPRLDASACWSRRRPTTAAS